MFYDDVHAAAAFIRQRTAHVPTLAIVLGSGLGGLAEALEDRDVIPYDEIPGFPHSDVKGHAARLVLGRFGGRTIAAMQGRFHFYEGFSMKELAFPIFVLRALGVRDLIVTNACGGINADFHPGDLMLITDHINLTGRNPLIGPNDERFGPRFPDMTEIYTPALRQLALDTAASLSIPLRQGVYIYFPGPGFETAAEIRAFRTLGADAVGMSTVPETTAACYLGLRVLGIACITNMATGISETKHSHAQVLRTAEESGQRLSALVRRLLERWPND